MWWMMLNRRFKRPYSVRLKDGLGACPFHAPMLESKP